MSVQPGQTIYAKFTVAEAPDADPTVEIYKVTAAGVQTKVTSSVSASVDLTGTETLAYDVTYTIPSDAAHGDIYTPLVTAIPAGGTEDDAEVLWLASAWVDLKPHGLTAEQAGQLDSIEGGVSGNTSIMLDLVTFIGQVPSQVWSAAERTLTAFGFNVLLTPETEADIDSIVANTNRIGDGTAIVFQPMTADGDEITIVRYDSYKTDMNRSMSWDFPAAEFGDWTGKEVNFKAVGAQVGNVVGPIALTVSGVGTVDQSATLELSSDDTDAEPGRYDWAVVVTDPSDPDFRLTARVGCMEVQDNPYSPG